MKEFAIQVWWILIAIMGLTLTGIIIIAVFNGVVAKLKTWRKPKNGTERKH